MVTERVPDLLAQATALTTAMSVAPDATGELAEYARELHALVRALRDALAQAEAREQIVLAAFRQIISSAQNNPPLNIAKAALEALTEHREGDGT